MRLGNYFRRCAVIGIIGCGIARPSFAGPVYAPAWADDPWATRALYEFPTASLTPAPDTYTNSHGVPQAQVQAGTFSTGWQDPGEEFTMYRVPEHGAWDLGELGRIEIEIPVGNAAGSPGFEYYTLDVLVYTIHYLLPPISVRPTLYLNGLTPLSESNVDALHTPDTLGDWYSRTWTASFSGITTDSVKLVVLGGGIGQGCVVDDVDAFILPQVIPEPTSAALLGIFGVALALRRRRRQVCATET